MIFKLKFTEHEEYVEDENILRLLQSYDREYGNLQDIEEVEEISDEEAKKIMLINEEHDEEDPDGDPKEISLFDSCHGDGFHLLGTTEIN